jgi:polyisoprenoid-binding protein YceI
MEMSMKTMYTRVSLVLFSLVAIINAPALLAAQEFTVQGGLSNISFESDAMLETITGTTSDVSGTVTTDLTNPSATTATVTVPVASLRTGVDLRDEHLVSGDWLDAGAHPNITFAIASVDAPSGATLTHGQAVTATVAGTLTIKGTSHEVSVPAQVTFYEVESADVAGTYGIEGNVLRVTSSFTVLLSDYGINVPGPLRAKVSNEIGVTIRLTAVQG